MLRNLFMALFRRVATSRPTAAGAAPPFQQAKAIQNPKLNALLAGLAILYAVSPIDIVPDFIPVVGWLDDGLILWLGFSQAWKAFRGQAVAPAAPANVIETTATRVA
jgi:uncharacterized membrane protein YkvA (DUF1232 family)